MEFSHKTFISFPTTAVTRGNLWLCCQSLKGCLLYFSRWASLSNVMVIMEIAVCLTLIVGKALSKTRNKEAPIRLLKQAPVDMTRLA